MRDIPRWRAALFLGACAAIAGVAVFFALRGPAAPGPIAPDERTERDGGEPATPTPPTPGERRASLDQAAALEAVGEDLPPGVAPPRALRVERTALEASARRFLEAFFRYEVGELSARARAALREHSTPEFAEELLAAPPRPPADGQLPPRAEAGQLEVFFLERDGFRAQVNGSARRGGRREPFSFLFERQGARWLASGIGR